MIPLRRADTLQAEPGLLLLQLGHGWRARVMLQANGDGRLTLLPPGGWREPRTWALDPSGRFPVEGVSRDALAPHDAGSRLEPHDGGWRLEGERLRATVRLAPFGVTWEQRVDGAPDGPGEARWVLLAADRESYAYAFSPRHGTLWHWQRRDADDRYFGLGDKTGPLDLHGRRLRTRQLDALGYDAKTGDPLYKHWPFLLNHRADSGSAGGLYYDTLAECTFDLGCEHDNYHGRYRATEIADGDLDLHVHPGPSLRAALARFVAAIGGTAMPPRWALGYANTAMALADAPDAQARITALIRRARDEGFPLSSFHFGSGYTSRGKRRYVFTWNRDKFPEPQALIDECRAAGVRTVANLKPCLLDDHPAYAEIDAAGGFVRGDDGACLEQFWDGWGAHLDFSRPADAAWWRAQFRRQILDVGIDVGWNDNNEYVIWGEDARIDGLGQPLPMHRARPLQALLMTRATHDEQAAQRPGERVYTITRAGPPGLQRHAQTWTGDNSTSWHTLRWNQRMALTMGLSGMFNTGHDIGGFDGPVPDAELLIRWTQACSLNPRMIMNSWKADGTVNTPWLHPEATATIRAAIGLRLQLLPYLYTQLWRSTVEHGPLLRPTFLDFGDDPATWADGDEMLVGPDLLVAPVFEPGARRRRLYLPKHAAGWWCWHDGRWFEGGQWVEVPAPLERLPLFVRGGALLPTTDTDDDRARTEEPSRALRWWPAPAASGHAGDDAALLREDDGLRAGDDPALHRLHRLHGRAEPGTLHLRRRSEGGWPLPYRRMRLRLPPGETRPLTVDEPDDGLTLATGG